jgi:hypothetical protein
LIDVTHPTTKINGIKAQKHQTNCALGPRILVETLFRLWLFLIRYERAFILLSLVLLQFRSAEVAS